LLEVGGLVEEYKDDLDVDYYYLEMKEQEEIDQ
jgi:hypothetical protein